MSVTEPNKRPGVRYAFAPDGLELPVIDVEHPAFRMDPWTRLPSRPLRGPAP